MPKISGYTGHKKPIKKPALTSVSAVKINTGSVGAKKKKKKQKKRAKKK